MKFDPPLRSAILIKRYKRFLADITLPSGETTTIHCANTGAMTGCATPGDTIWYSTSDNPKRKYPFSWELSTTQKTAANSEHHICINTQRPNQLVEEALNGGVIKELVGFNSLKREVKYGQENSKIDVLLTYDDAPDTYVEVKSCTLLDESINNVHGQGFFPDAVSTRGQKHLRELAEMAESGKRAVLLFAVMHSGITQVEPAAHIDKKYALLLADAVKKGVIVLCYRAEFINDEVYLSKKLPFQLAN